MRLLEGKKALIFGVANKRSIAWVHLRKPCMNKVLRLA